MKNRAQTYPITNTQVEVNKSTGLQTTIYSFPACWNDTLQVVQDFTGAKNTAVQHAHQFIHYVGANYVGAEVSGNTSVETRLNGQTRAFTRRASPGFLGVPSQDSATLYNRCLQGIYETLRNQGRDGDNPDLVVDLAEAGQTRRMLNSYERKLEPFVNSALTKWTRLSNLARAFFKDSQAHHLRPKEVGKKWLEYQYAWRPLIGDIHSTYSKLIDTASYNYLRLVKRASSQRSGTQTYSDFPVPGSTETVHWDFQERCKIVAEFGLPNTSIQRLAGFGSLNPASLVWELLPYSFVVDWIVDVGGYLRLLESELLFMNTLHKGYSVEGYQVISQASYGGSSNGPGSNYWYGYGNATAKETFKRRLPITSFTARFPTCRLQMGWQRAMSAASLLALHLK